MNGNWQNFTIVHPPLGLSIILFLELKHLAKFHCRHHQCHHIGHFDQYHIVYTLCFTGYYVDDNAHFYGLVVSAGGRDSS